MKGRYLGLAVCLAVSMAALAVVGAVETRSVLAPLRLDKDADPLKVPFLLAVDESLKTRMEIAMELKNAQEGEESGEPTAPPEPSESGEPSNPTNSTKSEEPSETTEPSESDEPSESTKPTESDEPSETTEPSESDEPSESTQPSESEEPSESTKPTESDEPSESTKPTESDEPSETTQPSESEKPSESTKPSENDEPSKSTEPSESERPTEPARDPGTTGVQDPDLSVWESAEHVDDAWFDDALFIGDSRTVGLRDYCRAGSADYFCSVGMSVFNFAKRVESDRGFKSKTLTQLLSEKTYGKIIISLGLNECGYPIDSLIMAYTRFVNTIRELQPEAKIIIEGIMAVSRSYAANGSYFGPKNLSNINARLKGLADGVSIFYLDINSAFADSEGFLPSYMSFDGCHLYIKYYQKWMDWLKASVVHIPV